MRKQWTAKWIMDPEFQGLRPPEQLLHKELEATKLPDHREDLQHQHMLVRKRIVLNDPIDKAHIDITADDYYKLYVNGRFVGQGPAQGYTHHYYYNRYDLSEVLQAGENIIAVHVYYQGMLNRALNSGDYRQGLIAEVVIDGLIVVGTDGTWLYRKAEENKKGESIGYSTQFLEHIDQRLKEENWRGTDYDDSHWRCAVESADVNYRLVLQPTPPVSVYEIKPSSVERLEQGHYIIDFGQEVTGQFTMNAHGREGQTVEIRCGEELEDTGVSVRYKMRCNCTYLETWTLSGKRDTLEIYEYKAFRYVEVKTDSDVLERDSFAAIVRHYPLDDNQSRFESSLPVLNEIWALCKAGVKYGSQEHYVDCPTREKGQYLGDNTITGHSHIYVSGDLRLFRKAIQDIALLSEEVCPGLMAVSPGHFMQEIADYSLQWPLQLLNYYWHSGDLEFLKEMYPVADGMMKYFASYENEDGLLTDVIEKWNLVDWPDNMRDGYDFELTKPVKSGPHNVLNAFYYGAMSAMNEIRKFLKIPHSYELERYKEAFNTAFFQKESGTYVDSIGSTHASLHANALPLLFGLVGKEASSSVIEMVKEKRMSCSVYMSYFLLNALAKAGEHEFVYDLMTSDEHHSWSTMLREGATTCFEAWSKDDKWNTSLCHPWASAPVPVLIEHVAGVRPGKPGWRQIHFSPRIPEQLERFFLEFHVTTGKVTVIKDVQGVRILAPEGVEVVSMLLEDER